MTVQEKAFHLFRRYGKPVRFAVKTILTFSCPGNVALIELVDDVLGCAHEYTKDNQAYLSPQMPPASEEELRRVGAVLDLLSNQLETLLDQVTAQQDPARQREVLEAALGSSSETGLALASLGQLAQQTHDRVLDIHAGQQRQSRQVDEIYRVVHQLLEDRTAKRPASPSADETALADSLTIERGRYDALITTAIPACLLLLVDQSRSMNKPFGRQPDVRKADGVAVMINSILDNLCLQCGRGAKLHVGVIGYGSTVGSILEGSLAGRSLVTTADLADNKLKVLDLSVVKTRADGRTTTKRKVAPIWIKANAGGTTTPMKEAFQTAHTIVSKFLVDHPNCFPPIVLNFTDGEPNTGAPEPAADALRQLTSANGSTLLFNAHLSDAAHQPVLFPSQESALPERDEFARRMFRMSSVLPDLLVLRARVQRYSVDRDARCFAFNGDLDAVAKVLQVGTSSYTGPVEDLLPALRPR